MLGLILNAIFFFIPAILFFTTNISVNPAFMTFLVIAIVYLVGNLTGFCISYCEHVKNIEEITERKKKKKIYEKQRDELIQHATLYLGDKFPEHEKELFKLIVEKNSEAVVNLLGVFPEIKSGEVLKDLVKRMQRLHGYVYEEELAIEHLKKDIRCRKRNPYILKCILPEYKEETT